MRECDVEFQKLEYELKGNFEMVDHSKRYIEDVQDKIREVVKRNDQLNMENYSLGAKVNFIADRNKDLDMLIAERD